MEPDAIQQLLENWTGSLLRGHRVKYKKIIEGPLALQQGNNPEHVREILRGINRVLAVETGGHPVVGRPVRFTREAAVVVAVARLVK